MNARLPESFRKSGLNYLKDPIWFFSINLAESHPDDRLALLGLLARIIHNQDVRIDRAVTEFKKLTKPSDHQVGAS